jgi:hypothetical protein
MTQENIPLTTADVFSWLSEEGHFLKRPPAIQKPMNELVDKPGEVQSVESWCPICGQDVDAHVIADGVKKEVADPVVEAPCSIISDNVQMPIVDVRALLGPDGNPSQYHYGVVTSQIDEPQRVYSYRAAHLVAACDPHLCLSVERVVGPLKLPAFPQSSIEPSPSQSGPRFPLDIMGTDKVAIESRLAPYAMLGLATQEFVRALVKGGLEVAEEEKANVGRHSRKRRRRIEGKNVGVSMLTPTHILTSVLSRGQGRRVPLPVAHSSRIDVAILGCLARLRVAADRGEPTVEWIGGNHKAQAETIKKEE